MMREKLVLVFEKGDEVLRHTWVIKKGFRGIRNAKKTHKLHSVWGDPVEIIGEGPVAELLRREYRQYYENPDEYKGVSSKEIVMMGTEITGVPTKKLQKISRKIMKKINK